MTKREIDPYTGRELTDHEWDGIKELNTPVPKPVYWFLGIGFSICVVLWILLPAWPGISTYTKGILGIDQRDQVNEALAAGKVDRSTWETIVASNDLAELSGNEQILQVAKDAGKVLFEDNCSVCHASGGIGNAGYPTLNDTDWLWGGTVDEIYQTLRGGINSRHDETRFAQMMAYGEMQILSRDEISMLTDYVTSFSEPTQNEQQHTAAAALFETNCSSCHGIDGTGEQLLGAPNLTDAVWLYGGDKPSIYQTIYYGRAGHMPHWDGRISDTDLKLLTLYVSQLSETVSED